MLIRSLSALTHVDPGFRTDHTMSFQLSLPEARYEKEEQVAAFYDRLITKINAVPGVVSSGAIMNLPLGGGATQITFNVEGRPKRPPEDPNVFEVHIATPGYFKTLGIPLKRGRLLDEHDRAGTIPVAIISERAVKVFFPSEDPIGKRIKMGWKRNGVIVEGTIVGVIGDTRQTALRDAAEPVIYFAESQVSEPDLAVAVRTTGNPAALEQTLKDVVHSLDSNLAVASLRPMDEVMHTSVARDRFMTQLLGMFSGIALLLAAVGIFGVISYGVTQRRREFGVRMAVGASRGEIVNLVLGSAMRLATGGLILGGLAAFALTRVLGALLFEVKPTDPLTYAVGAIGLFVVSLGASALPAWSASRLPPSAVLNTE